MLGEPEQQPVALCASGRNAAPSAGANCAKTSTLGRRRVGVPVVVVRVVVDERGRVVGRPASRPAGSAALHQRRRSPSTAATARVTTPARVPPAPSSNVEITVTERERICPLVVRLLPAQRRLVSVCSAAMTMQPSAVDAASAALDQLLRLGHHRPPSATVFSTLTPRNSAAGQPCETAATWPGWPLPQLNAPPST